MTCSVTAAFLNVPMGSQPLCLSIIRYSHLQKKSQAAPLRNAVGIACDFFIYRIV